MPSSVSRLRKKAAFKVGARPASVTAHGVTIITFRFVEELARVRSKPATSRSRTTISGSFSRTAFVWRCISASARVRTQRFDSLSAGRTDGDKGYLRIDSAKPWISGNIVLAFIRKTRSRLSKNLLLELFVDAEPNNEWRAGSPWSSRRLWV